MGKTIEFTPTELEIMRFIERFIGANGFPPTLEEISVARGVTKVTSLQHIANLCEKGAISRTKYRSRSIVVLHSVRDIGSGRDECVCYNCKGTGYVERV